MEDSSRFLHGRIDPGLEENFSLMEALEVQTGEETAEKKVQWDFEDAAPGRVPGEPSRRMCNTPFSTYLAANGTWFPTACCFHLSFGITLQISGERD
jgi:hypothetical protein